MAGQGLQHGSLNALDESKRILLGYWLCVIDELEGSYSLLDAFACLSDGPTSLACTIASLLAQDCRVYVAMARVASREVMRRLWVVAASETSPC